MADGSWRTVERISSELRRAYPATRFPESSISAQLRNLRKIGFTVQTRNILDGGLLYEYRLVAPTNPGVAQRIQESAGVSVG
jgi:predicted transcriptional regulator